MFIKMVSGYLNLLKVDYLYIDVKNSVVASLDKTSIPIKYFTSEKEAEKYLNKLTFKVNELIGGQI